MQDEVKVFICIYLIWLVFWYAAISMITWSINPETWDVFRVIYVFVGMVAGVPFSSIVVKHGKDNGL